ncbi:MAG: hypothetical protein ACI4UH_05330, partial [Dorea sp.]
YLTKKTDLSVQIQVCSSMKHVLAVAESGIDYLVISEKYCLKERKRVGAKKVFVLTSGNLKEKDERETALYKYQSGEKLLGEILKECDDFETTENFLRKNAKKQSGKIIGVFSPVHRIGKTTYALRMGEKLSLSSNVLYLNLEIFGGIGGHFEEGGQTLADVLYYVRQEKRNLGLILTTMVCHREGLDYILPMPVSEDVKEVEAEEWISLVRKIMNESIYETIILDIDEGIRHPYQLLKMCTEVHLVTDESVYSRAKERQFEKELLLLGYEDILRKMVRKEGHL